MALISVDAYAKILNHNTTMCFFFLFYLVFFNHDFSSTPGIIIIQNPVK